MPLACSTTYMNFPVPIKHGSLGRKIRDNQKIIDYFLEQKEQGNGHTPGNGQGWKTDWHIHLDHKEVLNDLILDIVRWHNYHVSDPRNSDIPEPMKQQENFDLDANVWFQEYLPGQISPMHDHGTLSRTSWVYYLKVEDDSSPLTFVRKNIDRFGDISFEDDIHLPVFNDMLVMFPSYLLHSVYPCDTVRYVLAGNFNDISYRNDFFEKNN